MKYFLTLRKMNLKKTPHVNSVPLDEILGDYKLIQEITATIP